jgi:hypothetical protein
MYCKSCGNNIDNDSLFCSFCGTRQSDINKPVNVANELSGLSDSKTVNVNLTFGRPINTQQTQSESKKNIEPKYDSTYEKENDASFVGVIILISSLLLVFFQPFKSDNIDSYNQFRAFSSIGAFVLRIIVTIWVVNIAKRQNRETFSWGIFAFFLPSISLIVIGQLKKIFIKPKIKSDLNTEGNPRSIEPITPLEPSDKFNPSDYPRLEIDIINIKDKIKNVPAKYSAEIIISFCKDHSIHADYVNNNPELTRMVVNKEISINLIEQLFQINKNNSDFIANIETYLKTVLNANAPTV